MAKTKTVWDASGVKRTVRSVDAAEILKGGGSEFEPSGEVHINGTPKVTYTEADSIAQLEDAPEKADGFPAKFPGAHVLTREGIGHHAALRLSRDELIAVNGIGEKLADEILALRK